MISRPSCEQLIGLVRTALTETVSPAVQQDDVHGTLTMIDSILASVAVRSAHEIAWMDGEIKEIVAVAEQSLADPAVDTSQISEAFLDLHALDATILHVADVQRRYEAASELLSRVVEHRVIADPPPWHTKAVALLSARIDREVEIRGGSFALAGRS